MDHESLVNVLERFASREGFIVSSFSPSNACFDLALRKGEQRFLVKVLPNVDSFREVQAIELRQLSHMLHAVALVVGERTKTIQLKMGVAYDRYQVMTVSVETFKEILQGHFPLIKSFKGQESVALDAEKLRHFRETTHLSLNELAHQSNLTPETIYRYEQGLHATLDNAKRLESIIGSNLLRPLHFSSSQNTPQFDQPLSDQSLAKLQSLGIQVQRFWHAPFKALSSTDSLVMDSAKEKDDLERKASWLKGTSHVFETKPFLIAPVSRKVTSIDEVPLVSTDELKEMKNKKELQRLLKERKK